MLVSAMKKNYFDGSTGSFLYWRNMSLLVYSMVDKFYKLKCPPPPSIRPENACWKLSTIGYTRVPLLLFLFT